MRSTLSRSLLPAPRAVFSAAKQPIRYLASDAYFPPTPKDAGLSGPSRSAVSATSSPSFSSSLPSITDPSNPLISSDSQEKWRRRATTESPSNLTDKEKRVISEIVRVDQAGELGANWIYRGQAWGMRVRGDMKTGKEVEEMWENEKLHLKTMAMLRAQHDVRPTVFWPVWQGMAFALGAGTALMGRHAAMACTEAVETVIGEHYDDQLRSLVPLLEKARDPHPSLTLLKECLTEFRDDELEHLDHAVEGGAQKAPGHALLSAMIGLGCKGAIEVAKRI